MSLNNIISSLIQQGGGSVVVSSVGAITWTAKAASGADSIFYVGATESFRIVNANAYVSVATRLGVGTAEPGYSLDIIGNTRITSGLWVSGGTTTIDSTGASNTSLTVRQTAASATVPAVVVRLGATPAAGGHAQEWQDSTPAAIARVTSAGLFGWIAGNTQTTVGAAGAASALPSAPTGYAKIDVDGTTYVTPYYAAA